MLDDKTKALEEIDALIKVHNSVDEEYEAGIVKGLEMARNAVAEIL